MKQRMIKAGILLLGLMVLFTILSRTAYNMSIAEVSTERAEPRTFTPDVSARGIVTGRREIAVSTVEGLRVGSVHVMEGQAVEAGEILFEVDLQDLMEKMKEKQQELQSLDLQIRGSMEAEAAAEQSRQLSRSQAQEDYNRTAARENAAVDAALAELQQAQEQYENFMAEPTEDQGQGKSGQAASDLSGSGPLGSGQADSGPLGSGQADSGPLDSGQAASGLSGAGSSDSGPLGSGQTDSGPSGSDQAAEQLLAAVQEKQAAYDQALQNREESLYHAQKSVDSANLGEAKSYSVEQGRITCGQKEEELAKLQALLDVQGMVAAPVKGMVTGVSVRAGTITTGGGDILISDISGGAGLTVTFPEEMRKYVREGSQAVVTAADSPDGLGGMPGAGSGGTAPVTPGAAGQGVPQAGSERVTIRTLAGNTIDQGTSGMEINAAEAAGSQQAASSGGSFSVTVDLSPDHFTAGEAAVLKVEAQPGSYEACIPTGALHLREKDQYYINVAEKRSTILGEEWVVRQVDVNLLEKDETYAAVEGISSGQEVVTEASRTLEDGSRVKMKDEK